MGKKEENQSPERKKMITINKVHFGSLSIVSKWNQFEHAIKEFFFYRMILKVSVLRKETKEMSAPMKPKIKRAAREREFRWNDNWMNSSSQQLLCRAQLDTIIVPKIDLSKWRRCIQIHRSRSSKIRMPATDHKGCDQFHLFSKQLHLRWKQE